MRYRGITYSTNDTSVQHITRHSPNGFFICNMVKAAVAAFERLACTYKSSLACAEYLSIYDEHNTMAWRSGWKLSFRENGIKPMRTSTVADTYLASNFFLTS